MFRVGQKVVCVDAKFTNNLNIPELIEGNIYTIKSFDAVGGVFLCEETLLPNWTSQKRNIGFSATRFRPIVSRPTSIEFAHKILRSVFSPTKESADV